MMLELAFPICTNGLKSKLQKAAQQRPGENGPIGQVYRLLKRFLRA